MRLTHCALAPKPKAVLKPHISCTISHLLVYSVQAGTQAPHAETTTPGTGIDLEFETDVQSISAEAAQYETCYVTAHKGPCRAGTFHHNGQLIATGSEDSSIKVRMILVTFLYINKLYVFTEVPLFSLC